MKLTKSQIDNVIYILTKRVKHRATQPFSNELRSFLRTDEPAPRKPYHFLSEDYYQYNLVEDQGTLELQVDSVKPEVVAAVHEVNRDFAQIFSNS